MKKILNKNHPFIVILLLVVGFTIYHFTKPNDELKEEGIAADINSETYDKLRVSYLDIKERKTGTPSFNSTSDMNGHDASADDNYLRTMDTMSYVLELGIERNEATTEETDAIYGGKIMVKITIPKEDSSKPYLSIVPDAWMKDIRTNDDLSQFVTYYEIPSNKTAVGGIQQLSVTFKANNLKHELTSDYMPQFEVWMEGNKGDNSLSVVETKVVQDEGPLYITATPYAYIHLDDGNVNRQATSRYGVKGQYINFTALLYGSSSKGREIPFNSMESSLEIEYYYKDIENGTDWIKIERSDLAEHHQIVLNKYQLACSEDSNYDASTYSDVYYRYCANNSYKYLGTTYSQFYIRNSGTFQAAQVGDTINFSNTGFSYYGNYDVVAVSDEFDLFVPWYEPTEGGRYQYQVVVRNNGLTCRDSENNEYNSTDSDVVTFTFHNYMTGNIEYGFYATSGSRPFSDTVFIPLNNNILFESYVSAEDGPYEGGLQRLIVWNSAVAEANYSSYYPDIDHSDNSYDGDLYLGVYKADPWHGVTTDEEVNAATFDDFEWYSKYDYILLKEKGIIAAYKSDEDRYEWNGYGNTSWLWDIRLKAKDDINLIGQKGIIRQKIYVYEDTARKIVHEIGTNTDYISSTIKEDGTGLSRQAAPSALGETYYIGSSMSIGITSTSDKSSYNVEEEFASLTIIPSFSNPTLGLEKTNFKIWVNVPTYLKYKNNSANYPPTSVVENSDGTSTITWEFNDWSVLDKLPQITYKLEISPQAPNNTYKYVYSYIGCSDVYSGTSYSGRSFYLINLSGSSARKTIDKDSLDINESTDMDNYIYNIAQSTLTNVKTVEILPKNGDSIGDVFSGTYTLRVESIVNNQKIYYTTNSVDDIGLVTDNVGNKHIQQVDLDSDDCWIEVHVGDTIPANATAIASYIPAVSASSDVMYRLKFIPSGNKAKDKYFFKLVVSSDNLENALSTEYKKIVVADREITGTVFFDIDRNNILSDADTRLANKTVKVYDVHGNFVKQVTTDSEGVYRVDNLNKGLYYISYTLGTNQQFVDIANSIQYASVINPETGQSDMFSELNRSAYFQEETISAQNKNVGIKHRDAKVIIHHYITGTKTKVHEDTYVNTFYTDRYVTDYLRTGELDGDYKDYYSYDELTAGDPVSAVVNKDSYEVIYYYNHRPAAVITHHYIKDTITRIAETEISMKHFGDTYTTSRINNLNYAPAGEGGDSTSGLVTKEETEVIYYYELKPAAVTVHHYEEGTTTKVHEDDILNRNYDEWYTTNYYDSSELDDNYKDIYQYSSSKGKTIGTVNEDNIEVIYYYAKKPAKLVVRHYILGTIFKVHENEVFDKKINDRYETDHKESNELYDHDYVYDSVVGNASGIMDTDRVVVTYYYKLKEGNIVVHHITDDTNEELCPDETASGTYKTKYNYDSCTTLSNINYTFKEVKGNDSNSKVDNDKISGRIEKDNTEITYYYTYKPGQIVGHYFLVGTRERVADDVIANGKLNQEYTSSAKELEGYKLVKEPEVNTITFKEDTQELVYEYERLKFKIEVEVVAGEGTITGAEEVFYGDNEKSNVVITPGEEYEVNSVKVNGKELNTLNIEGMTLNKFENIKENIKVEVSFTHKSQDIPITGKTRNTILYVGSILFILAFSIFIIFDLKKRDNKS